MPMTEQGFQKYTYAELLEQQITRAQEMFGEDIDTSDTSVLGKFLRLQVSDFAQEEEALEEVYLSRYVDTAYGLSLDRLTPFAGITRNAATAAKVVLGFSNSGSEDVTIDMGTKFLSTNGLIYYTTESVTVGAGISNSTTVTCTETGIAGNKYYSNSIHWSFYETQVPNIVIVSVALAVSGEDEETDAHLRARFKAALGGSASGTSDAIVGAVSQVDGVSEAVVYENDSDTATALTESITLPAHSFMAVVHWNEAEDTGVAIAAAILEKKPLGIQAYGLEEYEVEDGIGVTHTIGFTTAEEEGYNVTITTTASISDDEKEALLADLQTYVSENYGIGSTLYASSLYAIALNSGYLSNVISITINSGYSITASKTGYLSINHLTIKTEEA